MLDYNWLCQSIPSRHPHYFFLIFPFIIISHSKRWLVFMFTKTVACDDGKFPALFALKNKNKFWHSPPSGNLVKTRFGAILVYLEKRGRGNVGELVQLPIISHTLQLQVSTILIQLLDNITFCLVSKIGTCIFLFIEKTNLEEVNEVRYFVTGFVYIQYTQSLEWCGVYA